MRHRRLAAGWLVWLIVALCLALPCRGAAQEGAQDGPFRLDSDEFPIGMFSVDSPGAMASVSKMGIGYVHTYGQGRGSDAQNIAKDVAYLDHAATHGLKVMFNLNGRRWVDQEDGVAKMLTLVEAVKDHPAMGFWYFYDEPDGKHTAAELRPFYDALKKATPGIPVAIATAWSKHWYAHNDVLDLLMIDNYPVQHKPFPESDLSIMTRFTDSALGRGKPVIPINQCMNWKVLAGDRDTYRGSPVAELRFPTRDEIRYWCYSGAAQGVRGMFWWSFYRSVQGGYGWINSDFAQASSEFAAFTRLAAPAHDPITFKRSRDVNILMALWRRPRGSYLVAVNGWPLKQELSRWMEDHIQSATLEPWGLTRATGATLEDGKLNAGTAQPWEVFVWKLADVAWEK